MSTPDRDAPAAPVPRRHAVEQLPPSAFALVMATGIVSVAVADLGLEALAKALLGLNVAFYAVLWLVLGMRIAHFPRAVGQDLAEHAVAPGFLTVVAGTCVLGTQLATETAWSAAAALWILAAALYLPATYGMLATLVARGSARSLATGISGIWMVPVVATQGMAALGGLLAPQAGGLAQPLLLASLASWLAGIVLYLWITPLVLHRMLFEPLSPDDLTPPHWIDMGAMAISTLAGTVLVGVADDAPWLAALRPFLLGTTLLCWAAATWWIPFLVVLGVWRHAIRRVPLAYETGYWALVFPLGMYAVCTDRVAHAAGLPFLEPVSAAFAGIACAAWCVTLAGMTAWLARARRGRAA